MRKAIGMAMLMMAAPLAAQAFNGAAKIARGDMAAAERELVAQRALLPDDVDLMLNLAAVYAVTGRQAQARILYQRAATCPDEQVMMQNGASSWSREIAARGLAMQPAAVAAR